MTVPITDKTASELVTAIELAYGLLWLVPIDKRLRAEDHMISLARKTLLEELDRDGQARGITAAREMFGDEDQILVTPRPE